jgi:ribonucleoside-diphosphate reductase alpha chain
MATSVIDYIFRELAVSYLGRRDLAHAEPSDVLPDSMGRGNSEGVLSETSKDTVVETVRRYTSTGYVRNQLLVLNGGAGISASVAVAAEVASTGSAPQLVGMHGSAEAIAVGAAVATRPPVRLERVRDARQKGYEGDSCGECGNFTLVRSGTCMKCATCGATSGCS